MITKAKAGFLALLLALTLVAGQWGRPAPMVEETNAPVAAIACTTGNSQGGGSGCGPG